MCESCAYRPELIHCSQCRTPLYGYDGTLKLSRNRALEELASNTFPPVERESTGGRGRGLGNRGRGRRGGSTATTARVEDRDVSVIVRLLRLVGHRVTNHNVSDLPNLVVSPEESDEQE